MHLYLDIKYLSLIGNRLPLFKKKGDNLWNCRCTICGDSQTKKSKARGYFYVKDHKLFYRCHNCDAGMSFYSFLKGIDNVLAQEYALERFKESGTTFKKPKKPQEPVVLFEEEKDRFDGLLERLDTLDDENIAVKYCLYRKIPRKRFKELYYVDDISKLAQISPKYKDKIKSKEPRLVLPFYDWDGNLCGVAARDLSGKSNLRYIELKVKEDVPLIFGTESVDRSKHMYVVEGPIDSLFVKNSIAVGGTSFGKIEVDKNNTTYIIDNQPRNRDVCGIYKKIIDRGVKVVIWPSSIKDKDINDIVLNTGLIGDDLMRLIDQNTYQGLAALVAFNNWKRI